MDPDRKNGAQYSADGMNTTARQMTSDPTLKVLLVEDSKVLAARLMELLDQLPVVEVLGHVDNEHDAIGLLRRKSVDVVILDLQLRQGTGFGVLRALSSAARCKPHILVLTNYDLPEYRREATQLGADFFLDKSREYHRVTEILEEIAESIS